MAVVRKFLLELGIERSVTGSYMSREKIAHWKAVYATPYVSQTEVLALP